MSIVESIVECDGGSVAVVTITNRSGASVSLCDRGAAIMAVHVPDRDGVLADVVFTLEPADVRYKMEIVGEDEVAFSLPGTAVKVSYRWTEDNVLEQYVDAGSSGQNEVTDFGEVVVPPPLAFKVGALDRSNVTLWLNGTRGGATGGVGKSEGGNAFPPGPARLSEVDSELTGEALWRIGDWERGVMNEALLLASHTTGRQVHVFTTYPLLNVSLGPEGLVFAARPGAGADCGSTNLVFYEFSTF